MQHRASVYGWRAVALVTIAGWLAALLACASSPKPVLESKLLPYIGFFEPVQRERYAAVIGEDRADADRKSARRFVKEEHRRGSMGPDEPPIVFDNPTTLLVAVLRRVRSPAVVYPTERYYYYGFRLGDRIVSGNLRFTEAEAGTLNIGYFDAMDQSIMRAASFNEADGVVVRTLAPGTFEVSAGGLSRIFVLAISIVPTDEPALRAPSEQFVSGIVDEAGVRFMLVFDKSTGGFRYVLPSEEAARLRLEAFEPPDDSILTDPVSLYRFFRQRSPDRLVLVSVDRQNIAMNTQYDGPFDQVPPRLPLRDLLRRAYPYVEDVGGIDEHGNFLTLKGQRVAISPYFEDVKEQNLLIREYSALRENGASDEKVVDTLTYELKRNFRVTDARARMRVHDPRYSARWPSNHLGDFSRLWPIEDPEGLYKPWPRNHWAPTSKSQQILNESR